MRTLLSNFVSVSWPPSLGIIMVVSIMLGCMANMTPFAKSAQAADYVFGVTTTQESSGIAAALARRLNEQFPDDEFSYTVAGSAAILRMLSDEIVAFSITHHAVKEDDLVNTGQFERIEIFSNDFLLVGPVEPITDCENITTCLRKISEQDRLFLSRGDYSGTHHYELGLWKQLGLAPTTIARYFESVGGASNLMRICEIKQCYTLIDSSSFERIAPENLTEIVRDKAANSYALMYRTSRADDRLLAVIDWIITEIGPLSTEFGYNIISAPKQK